MPSARYATTASAATMYRRSRDREWGLRLASVAVVFAAAVGAVMASGASSADAALNIGSDTLGWLLWLGAGPVAWSLCTPAPNDLGLAAMAALSGLRRADLRASPEVLQWRAGVTAVLLRVLPAAAVVFIAGALATHPAVLLGLLLALVFGGAAAAILVSLALLCRRVGRPRGRNLFAAIVLLPWVVADVFGTPHFSLPGAFSALLTELTALAVGVMPS